MTSIYLALFIAQLACYFVFLSVVFKRPAGFEEGRKARPMAVRLGVIAQSLAYPFAWTFRRRAVSPIARGGWQVAIAIAMVSLLFAVGAILLAVSSKKHLGKQWALSARIIEGHRLVTDGPFGRVRHPIYAAMGLLLLSTIVGLSSPIGAALSVPLFVVGTVLRVRAEDGLLATTFGRDFDDYRRRVPAIFPRFSGSGKRETAGMG
jgi:protein-S-isoprenylcysteine O-methyltransferase Ste14